MTTPPTAPDHLPRTPPHTALTPPTELRAVETRLYMWAWELPWPKRACSLTHQGVRPCGRSGSGAHSSRFRLPRCDLRTAWPPRPPTWRGAWGTWPLAPNLLFSPTKSLRVSGAGGPPLGWSLGFPEVHRSLGDGSVCK